MEFQLSPYLFQIGNIGIRYYSLMYLLGLLITYFWLSRKYDKEKIADFCFFGFLALVVGARLGNFIFYEPSVLLNDPLEIFKIWHGGLSFHGGFLGATFFTFFFLRKHHWNFFEFTDYLVIPVMLSIGFGRIGNFFNGELWGKLTTVPWCFIPQGEEGCRHPSQLYQAFSDFLVTLFLYGSYQKHPRQGIPSALFLIGYGISRSINEIFWREPDWVFLSLSSGTWLSIPMILLGIYLLRKAYQSSPDKE